MFQDEHPVSKWLLLRGDCWTWWTIPSRSCNDWITSTRVIIEMFQLCENAQQCRILTMQRRVDTVPGDKHGWNSRLLYRKMATQDLWEEELYLGPQGYIMPWKLVCEWRWDIWKTDIPSHSKKIYKRRWQTHKSQPTKHNIGLSVSAFSEVESSLSYTCNGNQLNCR